MLSRLKTKHVLNGTKKVKNKHQETDGYGRDKRPEREKLKRKEITITKNSKNRNQKINKINKNLSSVMHKSADFVGRLFGYRSTDFHGDCCSGR